MKTTTYTFYFKGGPITVPAMNEEDAQILAQAEAIKKGWDKTIVNKARLQKLDVVIDWNKLNSDERIMLNSLLCKANYYNC